MPNELNCKCDQCGMIFPSEDNLFKHKTRFCVGVKDSGIGRKPTYSDDEDNVDHYKNHRKRSPIRKVVRHRSPVEKKREEINEWKRRRSIHQTLENFENRIQRSANRISKQENVYRDILLEYERIQKQERDILLDMYNLQTDPLTTNSKQTNGLMNYQKEQFEELQRRNIFLERERQVIQHKLEELVANNSQPITLSNYVPHKLLYEMKAQQEINEKALEFLRRRFVDSDHSITNGSKIPSLPRIHTNYSRPRQDSAETIRRSRNSYLQSGGHDANIIARSSNLEYRLRTYENYPWTKEYPEPLIQSPYHTARRSEPKVEPLNLVNEENLRLQNELLEMQRKFEILDTRTKQLELSMSRNEMRHSLDLQKNLSPKTDSHIQSQVSSQETNITNEHTEQQKLSLPSLDKRLTSRASPAMNLLASNMTKIRDPFVPQSYDPIGGFVIFFDFVVNLPSTVEQCCLITCLHHPKSGLGPPSQLEPFRSRKHVDEKNNEQIRMALIATKQPVPRCPPQQALTIVIEVQTGNSTENLQTNAWTKLPLFDNRNRLLSGRWKVPLKALPIHYEENLAAINTLPTYEHAELYYRLVNAQDGDDQSNISLAPNIKDIYNYPLQYRK